MRDAGILFKNDPEAPVSCYWRFRSMEKKYDAHEGAEMTFVLQSASNVEIFIFAGNDRATATSLIEGGDRMYLGNPVRVPITQPVIIVSRLESLGEVDETNGKFRSQKGSFEVS